MEMIFGLVDERIINLSTLIQSEILKYCFFYLFIAYFIRFIVNFFLYIYCQFFYIFYVHFKRFFEF